MTIAGKAELKAFSAPDEVREFPKGRLELIKAWRFYCRARRARASLAMIYFDQAHRKYEKL